MLAVTFAVVLLVNRIQGGSTARAVTTG